MRLPRGRSILLVLIVVALTGCSSSARLRPTTSTTPHGSKPVSVPAARLRRSLAQLVAEVHAPGAVLGVRIRGGPPIVVAVGRDPTTMRAFTSESVFRVASITKTFVGALGVSLIARHRMALDDHVSKFVPDWPHGNEITIRELLSHTSGIPPFGGDTGAPDQYSTAMFNFVFRDQHHRFTPGEVLDFVRNRPLLFPPGTRTSYSNINTILLGQIVAQITHQSLGRALHAEELDPLHLDHTRYAAEEPATYASGITPVGKGTIKTSQLDYTAEITSSGAAGAMISDVPDLLTWGTALLRDQTVVPRTLARTALRIGPGGTGLGVLGFDNHQYFCVFAPQGCTSRATFSAIGGSGAAPGARTILLYNRTTDTVIAVIVDRDGTPGVDQLVIDTLNLVARAERNTS